MVLILAGIFVSILAGVVVQVLNVVKNGLDFIGGFRNQRGE